MALGILVFFLMVAGSLEMENLTISQRCEEDTHTFLWEINQRAPGEYAVLMYDAFGRLGSNVKGGNLNRLGLLEECHSARGPTFSGEYCQVYFQQGKVQYFVAVCVPDSCSLHDVQFLVLNDSFQFEQMSLIPPIPSILLNESSPQVSTTHCSSKTILADVSAIVCVTVCSIVAAIPLGASVATAIIQTKRNREKKMLAESSPINTELQAYGTMEANDPTIEPESSPSEQTESDTKTPVCSPQICLDRFLQEFSLQNTCKGVLNISSSIPEGPFSIVNGIRALSLLWIINGHVLNLISNETDNPITLQRKLQNNFLYALLANRPATLSVDTFLLLSGMLSSNSLLSSSSSAGGKLSASLLAKYILNRVNRVHPLHLFMLCLCIALSSLVLWGPYWMESFNALHCTQYWWAHLLLIHNFFPETSCGWTWYLAVDFQCYITTPLLIFIYKWNKGVFAAVAGSLLLVTFSAGAFALMQLPVLRHNWDRPYLNTYYQNPVKRYGPFLIGILIGIYFFTKKDQLINKKWQAAVGWFCSLSVMAVVIGFCYYLPSKPDSIPIAIYQGLERTLWALGVSWIIVACHEGYGGFIKSLLSLGVWSPFCNISFACYLVHPVVIYFYVGMQQTPIHSTFLNNLYLFYGTLVVTVGVSYVLTVLIEKPYFIKYS